MEIRSPRSHQSPHKTGAVEAGIALDKCETRFIRRRNNRARAVDLSISPKRNDLRELSEGALSEQSFSRWNRHEGLTFREIWPKANWLGTLMIAGI
jgi:hypothetical protein